MEDCFRTEPLSSHASSHASTPRLTHSSGEEAGATTDGSQTSHSPPAAQEHSSHQVPDAPKLSTEVNEFLSDISNFLALGCLTVEDTTSDFPAGSFCDEDYSTRRPDAPQDSVSRLVTAGWVRVQRGRSLLDPRYLIRRIYILPGDVGLRFFDRQNRRLLAALETLVAEVDVNPNTWNGQYVAGQEIGFDQWATGDEGSLFYMFNKLPSPRPLVSAVKEKYTREAMEDLLDPEALLGLKTPLYPYQRRSAALMLQREAVHTLQLDPRLESRTAPDGSTFYYSPRELAFNRNARYYEASRGGILAETMGLGKTLMCLALVLATRKHLPKIPAAYGLPPVRESTASLADMAVSAINRKSVPWKIEFERIKHAYQDDMQSCVDRLERNLPGYEIPVEPVRWNRKTVIPPPQRKIMAATTIVVVPRNLCKQWHSEIGRHVVEGTLNILLMEEPRSVLPTAEKLLEYDVVLFSRTRFEAEVKDGSDDQGRRLVSRPPSCTCPYIGATRTVNCHCVKADDLYESPLKHLHFKRLIIDEGHFFSSSNTTAVTVAKKLVTADHRWVVSGTPAKDLLGVEADMSAAQSLVPSATTGSRDAVLDQRRHFHPKEDTTGAIKSLGALASHFLRIRPWAAEEYGERPAMWDEHIYRHEGHRRRTFSGFSSCLRRTLEAMVVKTQPEDVEQDIDLPPLSHEVIRLEPSFYDKLTSNLFSIVLTANAVTSERTDADYLFHKNSAQARYQLIGNLRQSAFFWTGFSEDDVRASQKNSRGYLQKEGTSCTSEDRQLLDESIRAADGIISSDGWKALSRSHELGLFVDHWPEESADFWSFYENINPVLTGISQLLDAQKHVNERIGLEGLGEGLAGLGIRALKSAREGREDDQTANGQAKPPLSKAGINLSGEPVLKRRASTSSPGSKSSNKRGEKAIKGKKGAMISSPAKDQDRKDVDAIDRSINANIAPATNTPIVGRKRTWSDLQQSELAEESPFSRSQIVGTTSAKLSYLISQILKYYEEEKILVFYDGDNIAYYIAQMLELLHIKHEIYAISLAAALKSEYVVRFNEEPQERVLLMDVKHAAFGLNISSASRIYFVNPVCRPNVEAQAIKRAHRIGQKRKVFVETLLLKGTIEEKMHERAKRMTNLEHHDVSHVEDDYGMREIIQGARVIPILEKERSGRGQMAPLEVPQQLWGRPGWRESLDTSFKGGTQSSRKRRAETVVEAGEADGSPPQGSRKKKKTVRVSLPSAHTSIDGGVPGPSPSTVQEQALGGNSTMREIPAGQDDTDDDIPMMHRWRRASEGSQRLAAGVSEDMQTPGSHAPEYPGPSTNGMAQVEIAEPERSEGRDRLKVSHLLN